MSRPKAHQKGMDRIITLPRTMRFTHAGLWAQYYHMHPEELPAGAPCPDKCPAEFTEYAKHHLPRMVSLHQIVTLCEIHREEPIYEPVTQGI